MAELNSTTAAPRKNHRRKSNARTDLTAMVDLAFLLITFFMLTTSLSKPKAMDLAMPDTKSKPMPVDEHRTMTIQIEKNNVARCFMGKQADAFTQIALGGNRLRREIMLRRQQVLGYMTAKGTPEKGLIVLIQPGKDSNYGDLVAVLDEMAITGIQNYAIAGADLKK